MMDLGTSKAVTKKYRGKTWNALGDSITEGVGTTTTYHAYLKDELGFATINNYGIGGSTIVKYDTNDTYKSMAIRYATMAANADLITVWGGTNDAATYTPAVPLGVMADRTVDTFYGAYHVLLSGLIDKYVGKKIAVFTPMPRQGQSAVIPPFVQAIKEVAGFYSVPCLDLWTVSNIYPDNSNARTALLSGNSTHPNAAGHRILADKIGQFLLSL